MLGIGFFHGALVSYGNLGKSYDLTYERLAFGDVWVRMAAAPDNLVNRIERLPGVRSCIGRISEEVRVALDDRPVKEVVGRLISLPAQRQPEINRVRVVEGEYFTPQGGREALLEISFARAHAFRVGEFIYPTIRGEEVRFRVVGLVQSPEYIYSIQSEQYLIPTPETFGVIFIPERQAETLLNMAGTINEICVSTTSATKSALVAGLIESITDRYGGEEVITRDEQPSNKLLMADLDGYRQMAIIFPLLFLTGTVLTTYTLLARLAQAQSVQIGVLRATGVTRRSILGHFLWLAMIPALAGGVVGIGLGYAFAWWITRLYVELINVPYMFFEARPWVALAGLSIAAGSGLIGALSPARAAAGLPPAVAMSQQASMMGHVPAVIRWFGAGLSPSLKFSVRNVIRRPRRAIYTVLGMILGVCLIVMSFAILDAVDDAIVTYFEDIERYDLVAGFVPEQSGRVITHLASWPGVLRAEPSLDIPVEIEHGGVKHSTVLSGLPADGQLRRLTTEAGQPIIPKSGDALLGKLLRKKLRVGEGDLIRIDYAQNRRGFTISRVVRVGPPVTQPIGAMVYMRMDDVQRLFAHRLGYPLNAVSGALVKIAPKSSAGIKHRLHRMPMVAFVQDREQTYRQIQELLRFTKAFTAVLAFFGLGLAFAVIFTSVSINVLERTRELATLRTIGFPLSSIGWLTTIENLFLAAVAAGMGIPIGRWLHGYLMNSMQTESMSLEPVIYMRTYLIAVFGVLLLTALSQVPSFFHLRRMDLAAAAKELTS